MKRKQWLLWLLHVAGLSSPSQLQMVGSTGCSLVLLAPWPLEGLSGVAAQGFPKYLNDTLLCSLSQCKNKNGRCRGWSLDEWQSIVTSRPAKPRPPLESHRLCSRCHIFIHHVLAHWSYQKSKFSKQFSVFSVYMLGFIMVCGQKGSAPPTR